MEITPLHNKYLIYRVLVSCRSMSDLCNYSNQESAWGSSQGGWYPTLLLSATLESKTPGYKVGKLVQLAMVKRT